MKKKAKLLSHVRLLVTLWTVAYQVPPCLGFSRQQYWSGLPLPSPGDLPHPGVKFRSPALQVDSLPTELPGKPHDMCSIEHSSESSTKQILSVQFSCSVVSNSLQPHESQHARAPCPSPSPGVHSDSRSSSP